MGRAQRPSRCRLESRQVGCRCDATGSGWIPRDPGAVGERERMSATSSLAHSPLGDLADHVIVSGTRGLVFRLGGDGESPRELALIDALLVAVPADAPPRAQPVLPTYADVLAEYRA